VLTCSAFPGWRSVRVLVLGCVDGGVGVMAGVRAHGVEEKGSWWSSASAHEDEIDDRGTCQHIMSRRIRPNASLEAM
jgi:hypothetical protein